METGRAREIHSADQQFMQLELHNVIKREMKSRGLTLNALAKKTGVPLSSLHGWIERRPPSGKNLIYVKQVADFFGLSLTALLFNVAEGGDRAAKVLFRSEFTDADTRYRLVVEKLES